MSRTQVINWMVAPDVARPNLLQNGGFEVWRQTPLTNTGSATAYNSITAADDWMVSGIGTDSLTVTRDTVNNDTGACCAQCAFTLGNSGGLSTMSQVIVGGTDDADSLRGRTVTLSIRVKCSTPNAVRAGIYAGAGGSVWSFSPYHSGSGQYETLTVTATVINQSAVNWHFGINFVASCTAYVDSAMAVVGQQRVNYFPSVTYPDALPNSRLATDVARANLLTNGGFDQWNRGSGPFTGMNVVGPDRWQFVGAGGDTFSVSYDNTHADGVGACAAVSFTKGSGQTGLIQSPFNDLNPAFARTVSFSIRVRTSTPNAVQAGVFDGSVWRYGNSGYHPGDGQYHTLTVPGVALAGGSPTGQGQCGLWFSATCTVYMDNACLVFGNAPADYIPLPLPDEVNRCLRYYQQLASPNGGWVFCVGYGSSGTGFAFIKEFKGKMGWVPTTTISAASTFLVGNGATNTAPSAVSAWFATDAYLAMNGNSSNVSGGQGLGLMPAGTTASITEEWNP